MAERTVLVVDDDVDALVLTSSLLAAKGYLVRSATDVAQALEAARAHPPDLLILDHHLPVQTGLQAVALLRAEPAFARVPIVLVSASRFPAHEVEHLDGYLQKPWDEGALLAAVSRHLASRTSSDGAAA